MAKEIFVGQIGVEFEATVTQDITGATALLIKYEKPSGKRDEWIASEVDASTGVINFVTTVAGDLDEYGSWILWAHVTFANGNKMAGVAFVKKILKEGQVC